MATGKICRHKPWQFYAIWTKLKSIQSELYNMIPTIH
jgi:hypothetical protein